MAEKMNVSENTAKKSASPSRKSTTRSRRASPSKRSTKREREQTPVTPEQRYLLIQEVAYFRAESDGFQGDPVDYWLAVEREVDARLARD